MGGFIPTTEVTILRGEMAKNSHDSGHVSLLAYATAEVGPGLPEQIVHAAVISGPFEVLDCDTALYQPGTLSIYTPDQDPWGATHRSCAFPTAS